MSSMPLVSIITPCYNGEKCVARLIESVLNQTYGNIEFIVVNDGSTDNSESVILSYKEQFETKGYQYKYIWQENQGLGGAINRGLKEISGEYLCWADADDYLEFNSIERRVSFLLDHPEYAIVTSNAYVRGSDDLYHYTKLRQSDEKDLYEENQFDMLLDGKGIFCSGCHMVRMSAFDEVNPERDIFPARRGQNWQLLLPIYYRYKRGYIDEPLYNYIDNPGSMSKDLPTLESVLFRHNEHEEIIMRTLEMIEQVQKVNLQEKKDRVKQTYISLKMSAAIDYHDAKVYRAEYKKRKETNIREMITYYRLAYPWVEGIIEWLKKIYRGTR